MGTPVWSHAGIICIGESYKDKVKLTFAKGASFKDPARLFNASLDGNAHRAIDIHEGESVEEVAFKALIREAVARNSAVKSKPSKKAKSLEVWRLKNICLWWVSNIRKADSPSKYCLSSYVYNSKKLCCTPDQSAVLAWRDAAQRPSPTRVTTAPPHRPAAARRSALRAARRPGSCGC